MPNSFSYRDPDTGEWAHNLSANIDDDVCNTYIDPIWDKLLAKGLSHIRVLEVGFGRGYNCAEIIKRCAEHKSLTVDLVGLEPHPEILQPWPEQPATMIAPWWDEMDSHYCGEQWGLEIRQLTAQHPQAFAGEKYHAFIVDLFSMSRHPEHWDPPFIANMSASAAKGALLSSYACNRRFRDMLSGCGWHPEVYRREGWRDTLTAVFDG